MKKVLFAGLVTLCMGSQSFAADIVDTAVASGNFNTLVNAVKIAGLVDLLKAPGVKTVFAPTDAAFAKIPSGDLAALLANPSKLRAVLLRHVYVGGELKVADIADSLTEKKSGYQPYYSLTMASGTVNFGCPGGEENFFSSSGKYCEAGAAPFRSVNFIPNRDDTEDQVKKEQANYVQTDIETSNGIIQAIDTVLQ